MIQATENMPWERLFLKILHSPTGGSDVCVTTCFFEEFEKNMFPKIRQNPLQEKENDNCQLYGEGVTWITLGF